MGGASCPVISLNASRNFARNSGESGVDAATNEGTEVSITIRIFA